MRAIAVESFGGSGRLTLADLPRPEPGRGELLIRTVAAGVNPLDWKMLEGRFPELPHAFPLIPGWDAAGVVEELGEGTSRFRKGDKVWVCARKDLLQWGTYAEFVAMAEEHVALVPNRLLFEEAAAVPVAALAAAQALFDAARVERDGTVLIHGAAGGVGHFAVQLARNAGMRVFGSAGTANQEFVLGLGAQGAIDYTREDFRDALRRLCPGGVDAVVDTVGGETLARSPDVLKAGGTLVSLAEPVDGGEIARPDLRLVRVSVGPDGGRLTKLAALVDRGKLRTSVSRIYPLAEAARAHEESRAGHVRGKLVLAL